MPARSASGLSGALFFTYAGSALVVCFFIGQFADRYGDPSVAVPGPIVFALGHLLLAIAWAPWVPFPAIVMAGFGFGATFPALTALVVSRSDDADPVVRRSERSCRSTTSATRSLDPSSEPSWNRVGFRWSYLTPAIVVTGGVFVAMSLRRPDPA